MSVTSLKKRFIPLGSFTPDAAEFAPGALDQLVNLIPVFGVYRTLSKLTILSSLTETIDGGKGADTIIVVPRQVTGTFVHRVSIDQSFDSMQPEYSEPVHIDGFQADPIRIGTGGAETEQQYWQALRGLTPDTATTVLFIPKGTERVLYGYFSKPSREWSTTDPLFLRFHYRIAPGFVGAYSFTVEVGLIDPTDLTNPAGFTAITGGSVTVAGLLDDLDPANGVDLTVEHSIDNAEVPDPGHLERFGWRLRHTIEADEENNVVLEPDEATSAALSGSASNIFGYETQANSNLAADVVSVISDFTDDDTYVETDPALSSSDGGGKGFFLRMPFPQFRNLSGHKIRLRYSMDSGAQFAGVGFYQGVNRQPHEGTLIKQWGTRTGPQLGTDSPTVGGYDPTLTVAGVNPEVEEITLTFDDLEPTFPEEGYLGQVSNWDDVWLLFFVWAPVQGGTATVTTLRPQLALPYTENVPWVRLPAFSDPRTTLGDSDDDTGLIKFNDPILIASTYPLPHRFEVGFGNFTGPRESIVAVRACARMTTAMGTGDALVRFNLSTVSAFQPGARNGHSAGPFEVASGVIVDYKKDLPLSSFPQLQDIRLEVILEAGASGLLGVIEVWVEIESGFSSKGRLHAIEYIGPGTGDVEAPVPIDVSWLRLDGPADAPDLQQDQIKAYIGTVEEKDSATQVGKIYEISSGDDFKTWEDVSRATDYFSNKRDKSWSFTNFGELVIGTNYADPVQVKHPGDADFRDLIGFDASGIPVVDYETDGGVYPRARFCATINAFLCLANCDPTSVVGTATPYSFWSSKYADPTHFHTGLTEWQSSVFQLVSTPGEITGLVGGEYGLIFKENSVWRADYVGLPSIFNFTQLSGEQGTVFSRSIVKVDDDVYFWGIGGIFVIRQGRELEELAAQGSVRKFVFDSQFESYAISANTPTLESEASSRVIGGYDTYTGCIFWSYQSRLDPENWYRCDSVIVYSPKENRFSFLRGDMAPPNFPTDRIVDAKDMFYENELLIGGYLSLGNRQVSGESYLLKTILALHDGPQVASFSGQPVYEQLYRSNTISSTFFGAPLGVEVEIHQVRAIFAVEGTQKVPRHQIWIEANQSPAVGDFTGRVVKLDTQDPDLPNTGRPNAEGWVDLPIPISGEFFKFALAFAEYNDPIVKEVHGWQVRTRIAGDR